MIPYDDLVAALQAWRARQGLPVSTLGGAPPSAAPEPAPVSKSGSGPRNTAGAAPSRPTPPPPRGKPTSIPPPLQPPEMEVSDDALLDEASYENEGDDFAMKFGSDNGRTAVGGGPSRDSVPTDPRGQKSAREEDDW